ncbi:MAG: TetR/AcrR family transcriptional regulator C-terminal domain-containing protein [Fastidiosipilaceae bacterium]
MHRGDPVTEALNTKDQIALTMIELMGKKPMEKISVAEICETCGVSRKSFYYHFKDKYDLVNWIFHTNLTRLLKNNENQSSFVEIFNQICEYLYDNRTFYANALQVRGQNSFSDYFAEVMEPVIVDFLKGYISEGRDQEFFITFYTDALRMSIKRWLLDDEGKRSPQEFVRLLGLAIKGISERLADVL